MTQRLPRPDRLLVEARKVSDYLLNSSHPDGKAKAGFFTQRGFSVNAAASLTAALVEHGQLRQVVTQEDNEFGRKYIVECAIHTPDGENPCIRSVWIVEADSPPRLVTAYPFN